MLALAGDHLLEARVRARDLVGPGVRAGTGGRSCRPRRAPRRSGAGSSPSCPPHRPASSAARTASPPRPGRPGEGQRAGPVLLHVAERDVQKLLPRSGNRGAARGEEGSRPSAGRKYSWRMSVRDRSRPARFATGSFRSRLRDAIPEDVRGPATVSAYHRARLARSEPIWARKTSRESGHEEPARRRGRRRARHRAERDEQGLAEEPLARPPRGARTPCGSRRPGPGSPTKRGPSCAAGISS